MALLLLLSRPIESARVSEHGERCTATFNSEKLSFCLRSKTDVAMINETLCKILCHNLVVLIHETHELGIDPVLGSEKAA